MPTISPYPLFVPAQWTRIFQENTKKYTLLALIKKIYGFADVHTVDGRSDIRIREKSSRPFMRV